MFDIQQCLITKLKSSFLTYFSILKKFACTQQPSFVYIYSYTSSYCIRDPHDAAGKHRPFVWQSNDARKSWNTCYRVALAPHGLAIPQTSPSRIATLTVLLWIVKTNETSKDRDQSEDGEVEDTYVQLFATLQTVVAVAITRYAYVIERKEFTSSPTSPTSQSKFN